MKKLLSLALALMLVLSLAACGSKTGTASEGDITSQNGSNSSEENAPDVGELNDMMHDAFGRDDGLPYQFPTVDSYSQWPGAEVWQELGLPDMTPATMTNGEVYNGGDVYNEGYIFGFMAQCDCGPDDYQTLADLLWENGFRGMNVGNGIIREARSQKQLMEDNPNYYYYRAFYTLNGTLLQVELQKTTFDDTIWVGVNYPPSMEDFENLCPESSWPSLKEIIGADLPNPGTAKVYSRLDESEDSWYRAEIYADGLTQEQFDTYVQNLRNGGVHAMLFDEGQGVYSWSMGSDYDIEYSTFPFYMEDYDAYPFYINISYTEGVMTITLDEI